MPPDLDVYVLCRRRDLATINAFLDAYVDRERDEDRGNADLMLRRLGTPSHSDSETTTSGSRR